MSKTLIKTLSIIALIACIANLLLFATRVISSTAFWIIIIILALIAFPGLNWLKKRGVRRGTG